MKLVLSTCLLLAGAAASQIKLTTDFYTMTFRQGWSANPNPAPNPNSRAVAQRDFGSTVSILAGKEDSAQKVEDNFYLGLSTQGQTETIERGDRRFGEHTFTVSEWKAPGASNSRSRFYILTRPGFIIVAVLAYSVSPDLCCVTVADTDAALETLALESTVGVRLPGRDGGPGAHAAGSLDMRNLDLWNRGGLDALGRIIPRAGSQPGPVPGVKAR